MLVRSLEVQLSRKRPILSAIQHIMPGGTAVEADVKRVLLPSKCGHVKAGGHNEVRSEQLSWRVGVPGVRSVLAKMPRDGAHRFRCQQRLAALIVKHGDWQSPEALAADAPVRPAFKH